MDTKELYKKAIDKWGKEMQMMMVVEETAELNKELIKNIRGRDNRLSIAEEIADVKIMIEQMEQFFDCSEHVKFFKERKLKKLAEKLTPKMISLREGTTLPENHPEYDPDKVWIDELCPECGRQLYSWDSGQGCGVNCSNENCRYHRY